MAWTDVLKAFFGPREFLEHFQEKLGGNIVSSESRSHRTRNSKREILFNNGKPNGVKITNYYSETVKETETLAKLPYNILMDF